MKEGLMENKNNGLKFTRKNKLKIKNILAPCITSVVVCCLFCFGVWPEIEKHSLKSLDSNTNKPVSTVNVYTNGQLVKTYHGRIDIKENSNTNKVEFDLNGKRKIFYNATVIVEED